MPKEPPSVLTVLRRCFSWIPSESIFHYRFGLWVIQSRESLRLSPHHYNLASYSTCHCIYPVGHTGTYPFRRPLANRVGFPSLALERVLLALIVLVGALRFPGRCMVLANMLGMVGHSALVHFLQRLHCQLDIGNKGVTSGSREVFTDNDPHEFELLAVRSHGVRRHHPAPLP